MLEGAGVGVYLAGAFLAAATTAYFASPVGQRSLATAIAAGSRGSAEAADAALALGRRALQTSAQAWAAYKASALVSRFGADIRYVFATYTVKLADGSTYSGRTSGLVRAGESDRDAARRIVDARWTAHHMSSSAAPGRGATLDAYVAGDLRRNNLAQDAGYAMMNYAAIRGREQQLIDVNGGAQSEEPPGTSGNAIRGVAVENPVGAIFDAAAHVIITPNFGPAMKSR